MKKDGTIESKTESTAGSEDCDYVFKGAEIVYHLLVVVLTGDSGVGKSNILLRYENTN